MRKVAGLIAIAVSLGLGPVSPLAEVTPKSDSALGLPRERLVEFWQTYNISSMHYEKGAPSRIVGYFLRLDSSGSPFNAAMGFLEANPDIFGMSDPQAELTLGSIKTDSLGGRVVILQQVCQGLPVAFGHLDFAFTPEGSMEVISGRYIPDIHVSVKPQIDSLAAIGIVQDSLTQAGRKPATLNCQLCILPGNNEFVLAWKVLPVEERRPEDAIFVNAISGEIIARTRD